jgi:hypothetical protein
LTLSPMPTTVAELKLAVNRERRRTDRRAGKPDTRVFQYERRVGQRRATRADDYPAIEDDMIVEIIVEAATADDLESPDFEDMTRIFGAAP